eukprot:g18631.t1
MPLRMPVQSIVGRPIYVEKPIANPTQEQVDELHQRYVNELRKIYEEWKKPFMEARAKIMESQGEAAKAAELREFVQRSAFREFISMPHQDDPQLELGMRL